jgi:hypothetical protein
LLAPGVAPSNPQSSGSGPPSGSPLADSGFTFGGLRPRSNSISIDGLDNTDATTGAARVTLSPEIVREFQIINNGLSAESGGTAGGAINVVTKTGSNDFHGDAFLFAQNELFNARDTVTTKAGAGVHSSAAINRDSLWADRSSAIGSSSTLLVNKSILMRRAPRKYRARHELALTQR